MGTSQLVSTACVMRSIFFPFETSACAEFQLDAEAPKEKK